jgi:hypothetical protein
MMTIRKKASAWLQYLYFLRFSIIAWWFLPTLIFVDRYGYSTTITRAFMAPNSASQAFHIAFFTFSFQVAILVVARNICMNGQQRFETAPPATLSYLFCDPGNLPLWLSFALAQIPAVSVWLYVAHVVRIEGETNLFFGHTQSHTIIWLDFALGIGAAVFFWYSVSLFYYWTYTEPAEKSGAVSPKPLIFPKGFFGDLDRAPRPIIAPILEIPLRGLLRLTYHGFAPGEAGPLWELHFLSFVSLVGFFLLYLFLFPLTAPIPRNQDLQLGSFMAYLIALLFILGILFTPKTDVSKWAGPVKVFFVALAMGLATIFRYSAHVFQRPGDSERALPVLATILVIASFSLWALGGLGFLFDRYRVPVVTVLLLFLFLPKLLHVSDGEHYFLAAERKPDASIPPSPSQTLRIRRHDKSEPLIIITATGGGIHSAVWTTEILGRLEKSFSEDPKLGHSGPSSYSFHDHVLLASGVSGGSVGLMSYLLEYTASPAFDPAHLPIQRMNNAAGCSSIEDVAWGLEYYDLIRFVWNFWFSRPGIVPPDRNWALTKAFSRNLNDSLCHTSKEDLAGC